MARQAIDPAWSSDHPTGDIRAQAGRTDPTVDGVEHAIDFAGDGGRPPPPATRHADPGGKTEWCRHEEHRCRRCSEGDSADRGHGGNSCSGDSRDLAVARAVDFHPHHGGSDPRVTGAHVHPAHAPELPLADRSTHRPYGPADETAALRPHAVPVAHAMAVQMMTVNEPSVETGEHVSRRSDDFPVDRHDCRTDDTVTNFPSRYRVELFDRQRPTNGSQGDADFGSRFDERLLAHPARRRQRARPTISEITRPAEHPSDGVVVERSLRHRPPAYWGARAGGIRRRA